MSGLDLRLLRAQLAAEDPEDRRRAVIELPGNARPELLELLVDTLGDDDWRVRKEAAARVARWGDIEAATLALIAVVRDTTEVGRRNAALESLARIGRPAVAPLLGEVSTGGDHRKFLVDALGAIGEGDATPVLTRLLADDDPNLRVAAAEALRQVGGVGAKTALRRLLADDDLTLRLAALEGLAVLQVEVTVAEIRPSLEEPVLRKAAIRLLGWSRDPVAVPHLVDALRDSRRALHTASTVALATLLRHADDDEAGEIRRMLGGLGPDARAHVVAVFASSDPEARRAAAVVLGGAGAREFVAALAEGLADPSVADACLAALATMGAVAVDAVLAAADRIEPDLRADLYDAVASLGQGGDAVDRALGEAVVGDDERSAAAALRALGAVGGAGAEARAATALGDDSLPEVAAAAATALGRLGVRGLAPQATSLLTGVGLSSPLGEVRAAASLALSELGGDDVADVLAPHLEDPEPYARLAAIRALGTLGGAGHQHLRERLPVEDDAEMAAAIRAALSDAERSEREPEPR